MFFLPVLSNFLLVSTGYDETYLKNTEVLNLDSNDTQVPTYLNHPKSIKGATGGLISNQFITCGGYNGGLDETAYIKECYKIGKNDTSLHGTMKDRRAYAASILLTDRLWILGGGYFDSIEGRLIGLISTEYILQDGKQEDGPDLPFAIYDHAAIQINETHFMIVGGLHEQSYSQTWIYSNGKWTDGPALLKSRFDHSIGKIRDSVTHMDYIVVSGGRYSSLVKDTEILAIDGTKWETGKLLLKSLKHSFINNVELILLKGLHYQRHFGNIQASH